MNKQQREERLKKLDEESRSDRAQRWGEISHIAYIETLPELLWEYSAQAIHLYMNGNFGVVIIWCATMLELALGGKLISEGKGTKEVIELLSLREKTALCRQYEIINKEESKMIDKVRESRNAIVHANVGKLAEMAKKSYGDVGDEILEHLPELFLGNLGGGIQSQALKYIKFTRKLAASLYDEKPADAH
jgi:hypothetical protein